MVDVKIRRSTVELLFRSPAPQRKPELIVPPLVCQQIRSGLTGGLPPSAMSQLLRCTVCPPGAKPQLTLLLKYHSTPLALCVTLPEPVSNVTSLRGACASTRRFG